MVVSDTSEFYLFLDTDSVPGIKWSHTICVPLETELLILALFFVAPTGLSF